MIYEIGDKTYLLEEIICIDKPRGEDVNRIICCVWLRGCIEKTICTIRSLDVESNKDSSGWMNPKFSKRAYSEFEDFKNAWIKFNSK